MHQFNLSFTKSRAQLVEIVLEGPKMISVGKRANATVLVVGEDGQSTESRVYGTWITPSLFVPKEGQNEADTLARLETAARNLSSAGVQPKLVVIRAGELRGYIAYPMAIREDGEGLDDAYMLSLPAIRL